MFTSFYLRRLVWGVILLIICVACSCHTCAAETLSQVVNPKKASNTWVSDRARVIDSSGERRLNSLIDRLERRTTAEIAVVTIRRTDGRTPKQFATKLFNLWGIGKRGKDNGVLMLVVMDAHRVEVETGNGIGRILPDSRVQEILNRQVVPRFKEDDYTGGIYAGVQALAQEIMNPPSRTAAPRRKAVSRASTSHASTKKPMRAVARSKTSPRTHSGVPSPPADPFPLVQPSPMPTGPAVGWIPVALGILLLPCGAWIAWNSGIRRCPQCRQQMRRLSEAEDDVALATDQQFEENLGSVDYRVWRCEQCGTSKVERAVKWFSGYDDCPNCRHRTVQVQTDILRHPSYDWEGESVVTRTCRFPGCSFHDSQRRVLPRRTRPASTTSSIHHSHSSISSHHSASSSTSHSSSHNSGNFGGGSSSGGGAGASW